MGKSVIKFENISKRYRIGLNEKQSETLIDQVGDILKSLLENFKRLRQTSRSGVEDESVFRTLKDIYFNI